MLDTPICAKGYTYERLCSIRIYFSFNEYRCLCPISISKPAKRITFVSDPLRGSKMANVTQCKRKGDREYASRCIVIDDDGRMVGLLVGWLTITIEWPEPFFEIVEFFKGNGGKNCEKGAKLYKKVKIHVISRIQFIGFLLENILYQIFKFFTIVETLVTQNNNDYGVWIRSSYSVAICLSCHRVVHFYKTSEIGPFLLININSR